jgi:hypothetical protein
MTKGTTFEFTKSVNKVKAFFNRIAYLLEACLDNLKFISEILEEYVLIFMSVHYII